MLCKLEKEAKRKSRKVDIVSFLGTLVWCFSWLIPSFQGFTVKTSTENEERTQLNSKCSLLRDRLHNNNCREMVSVCKLGRNRQSNRFQRRQIGEKKSLFSALATSRRRSNRMHLKLKRLAGSLPSHRGSSTIFRAFFFF